VEIAENTFEAMSNFDVSWAAIVVGVQQVGVPLYIDDLTISGNSAFVSASAQGIAVFAAVAANAGTADDRGLHVFGNELTWMGPHANVVFENGAQ
jgi:hypothetical protein